jgi:hypothetical protein
MTPLVSDNIIYLIKKEYVRDTNSTDWPQVGDNIIFSQKAKPAAEIK